MRSLSKICLIKKNNFGDWHFFILIGSVFLIFSKIV